MKPLLAVLFLAACSDGTTVERIVPQECEATPEVCNGVDDDCDGAIDNGVTNVCGGCEPLSEAPLEVCGQCDGGVIVCATPDATACVGATPPNACGGCEALVDVPGRACGDCGRGAWTCRDGGLVCDGDDVERNACGGCDALRGAPADPCGVCGSGQLVCDGDDDLVCEGDAGLDALNVCGVCGELPEQGCGICGDGVVVGREDCDDGNREGGDGCDHECRAEEPWVDVLGGTWSIGSPEDEPGRRNSELLHTVRITHPFRLRAYETTADEWREVVGTEPSALAGCGGDCPVTMVSWWDAVNFLNALSESTGLPACYRLRGCTGDVGSGCEGGEQTCTGGFRCSEVVFEGLTCRGFRLPTEAEWEVAARAGTTTAFHSGPLVSTSRTPLDPNLDAIGWYAGNSDAVYDGARDCSDWRDDATTCGPQPVGGRMPNAWGLYDMSGNAYEWVWDLEGDYPEGSVTDPLGPVDGDRRMRRGGSWSSPSQFCRSAFRFGNDPAFKSDGLGFRIARTIP